MELRPIAPNMTELHIGNSVILFSYRTPVAALIDGGRYVRTRVKYSATTSRHIKKWLGDVDAELVDQNYLDQLACSCER